MIEEALSLVSQSDWLGVTMGRGQVGDGTSGLVSTWTDQVIAGGGVGCVVCAPGEG